MDFISSGMPSFSIIIVTWNALEHLKTFLPSVCATKYPSFEIILADNASGDGTAAWVRKHYPQINIVSLDKNYGYCGGNNRAAEAARFENLVFLNNDVEVLPDWLDAIAEMLASNPNIGAVQPKIKSWKDKAYFEYAGAAGGCIDKYGYPFCHGRLFDVLEKDEGQFDRDYPIFWASGAALVIRKPLFEKLAGFDESFEFHMEEIDLCWRLQQMGHQVWYCHRSTVYHLGGGSLPVDSPRKTYYNFRNNLTMLAKNLHSKGLLSVMATRILLDEIATAQFALKGRFRAAYQVQKSFFAFIGRISGIMRYRKQTKDTLSRTITLPGYYPKSIVWAHFVKNIRHSGKLPL